MISYRDAMEFIGLTVDAVGVFVIVAGAVIATWRFLYRRNNGQRVTYRTYRQDLARAILLGLEFLIAGDIIRTVAVAPTLENVGVLGLIVVVRTFLSVTLHLEVEGRWPWQNGRPLESPAQDRSPLS